MEILIPGLILVALMVYASTKIKRKAAMAYDEERFDAPDFSITKPEGFIIPAEDSEFAFAAYSKEFGADEADEIRQVSAEIKFYKKTSIDAIASAVAENASEVVAEQRLAGGGLVIETKETKNGVNLDCEYRILECNGGVLVLAVRAVPEFEADQQRNIDTFISSFELK